MQFHSWRIRLLIANLNIVTQWCAENIDTIPFNIPQMKITAVNQWTATFTIQKKPQKYWCLLRNFSSELFDHKKFQNCSRTFPKFQQNSRTFQDWWEPCHSCMSSENVKTIKLLLIKYWLHNLIWQLLLSHNKQNK